MADAPLTKEQLEAIKQGIIALVQSGQAPEDLMGHLEDMGIETPEELMTTHLPEGHWEMMQAKWLGEMPEAPESSEEAVEAMDAAEEESSQQHSTNRMSLPEGFAPANKVSRLVGLEKAGEEYDLSSRCAMHKQSCKAGESCPMCKMCSLYES